MPRSGVVVFRGLTSAAHSLVFPEPYLPLPQWRRSWSAVSVKRECENTAWVAAHGRAAGCKGQALRAVRALRPPQASLQSRAGREGARGPWGGGAEKSLLAFSATLFYPILATRSAGLLPHSHSASHSNRAPRPTPAWHPSTLAVSLLSQYCTFPLPQSSRWGLILTDLLGCRGGNDSLQCRVGIRILSRIITIVWWFLPYSSMNQQSLGATLIKVEKKNTIPDSPLQRHVTMGRLLILLK